MRTKFKAPRTHFGGPVKNRECTDVPRTTSIKEKMPAQVKMRDNGNYDVRVAGQALWNISPAQAEEIFTALRMVFGA